MFQSMIIFKTVYETKCNVKNITLVTCIGALFLVPAYMSTSYTEYLCNL